MSLDELFSLTMSWIFLFIKKQKVVILLNKRVSVMVFTKSKHRWSWVGERKLSLINVKDVIFNLSDLMWTLNELSRKFSETKMGVIWNLCDILKITLPYKAKSIKTKAFFLSLDSSRNREGKLKKISQNKDRNFVF